VTLVGDTGMPVELRSEEDFLKVLERASECRVKLGYRRVETGEGRRKVRVLKVKARTPRYLYTLVFEDVDKGIEFVKSIRDKCSNLVVLDREVEERLEHISKPLKVAVMGCAVNGPGEAMLADAGIAGAESFFLLFVKGKVIGKLKPSEAVDRLVEEVEKIAGEN